MSVLESMRSGTDSTAMQVVLALVLVSFIFWYATPNGDKTNVVVTVNGTRIMSPEYGRAVSAQLRRYDRSLTDTEEAQIRESVRQQLIEDEVVLQEARRLGLQVSSREIGRVLLDIPYVLDDDGVLDDQLYDRFVTSQGFATHAEFEDTIGEDILRSKLRYLVYSGVTLSEPVLREEYVRENTKVELTTVRLRPSTFSDDVTIDEAELASWMEGNAARIKERYDAEFERSYNIPEKVRLTMIALRVPADGPGVAELRPILEKIKADVDGGADMSALARRWSEDASAAMGGSLGELTTQKLAIPVADAVGALSVGGVSPIIVEDDRISFVRLDDRAEAHVIPLEEVQREIAERLYREEKAPALQAAFSEELLAKWQETGEAPAELLATEDVSTSSSGLLSVQGKSGGLFDPPERMLREAGKAEVGSVLPEVYADGDVLWVGALTKREEADMETYEAEKDRIREEILGKRRYEFFQAWVDDLVAKAKVQ